MKIKCAIIGFVLGLAVATPADIIVNIEESGDDIALSFSGSINLTGL